MPVYSVKQLEDLQKLNSTAQQSECGPVTAPTVQLLARYLDTGLIPTSSEPKPAVISSICLAIASIRLLFRLDWCATINAALIEQVAALLPQFSAWVDFIVGQHVDQGLFAAELQSVSDNSLFPVVGAILSLCSNDELHKVLVDETSVLETFAHHWIDEAAATTADQQHNILACMECILSVDPTLSRRRRLVRAVGGNYHLLARTALRHLHMPYRSRKGDAIPDNVSNALLVIMRLSFLTERQMMDAFLSARGLPLIIAFLVHLSAHPDTCNSATVRRNCISSCFIFIGQAFTVSSHPARWVLQGVRHGILPLILQCALLTVTSGEQPDKELWSNPSFVLNSVSAFMVYYSVTRVLARRMKKQPLPATSTHPLKERWSDFLKYVAQQTNRMADFKNDFHRRCCVCGGNANVALRLKTCAGCAQPRYCSLHCQKRHWSLHRGKCMQYQGELADESKMPLPLYEEAYILDSAAREVVARLGYIKRIKAIDYPTTPMHELQISLDWLKFPHVIELLRVDGGSARVKSHGGESTMSVKVSVPWKRGEVVLVQDVRIPEELLQDHGAEVNPSSVACLSHTLPCRCSTTKPED